VSLRKSNGSADAICCVHDPDVGTSASGAPHPSASVPCRAGVGTAPWSCGGFERDDVSHAPETAPRVAATTQSHTLIAGPAPITLLASPCSPPALPPASPPRSSFDFCPVCRAGNGQRCSHGAGVAERWAGSVRTVRSHPKTSLNLWYTDCGVTPFHTSGLPNLLHNTSHSCPWRS
jgi:hypothetical protein